jgi:hypothetical protein
MQEQDIEVYLTDLGQELTANGIQQPIRILRAGSRS